MLQQNSNNQYSIRMLILLILLSGAAVLLISPVLATDPLNLGGKPVVVIVARGAGSYNLGEEVVFSGVNSDSNSTYLFITGPNLPDGGGKLSSPYQNSVSGDPGSFTMVKTKPDKTWEYTFYTSGVKLDNGTYTIYAVSQPKTKDQFGDLTTYGTTSIILKNPFITAGIIPSPVVKGQPITVTGTAEDNPAEVQIWILGDHYQSLAKEPVSANSSYKYRVVSEVSANLPTGSYYLIVQHPMQNKQFDIVVLGDYVRSRQLNNGTNLFRISGPGSLQDNDAAEALVAAFSDPDNGDDTYTLIPFHVTDAESPTLQATTATTAPVQHQTQHAPLQYALFGAIIVVAGIVILKRH